MGWSRTVPTARGRRLIISWSGSGSFHRCLDRGYDVEDRLRIGGRHLRLVVRHPTPRVAPAPPEVSVSSRPPHRP